MRVDLSKTEKYLLAVTALFLCAMALLLSRERPPGEAGQYTIVTERPALEETAPVSALIDLNTATAQELMELPGVGEVIAQRILDWRVTQGPFTAVEQLLEVKGIGETKLSEIKDSVCIGGTA